MATKILLPITTALLFLVLALSSTRATAKHVLDTKGNPLEASSQYYIRPAGIGFRGGITRSARPGQIECPLYAVESPSEVEPGKPVKILPKLKTNHIHVSSPVQIDSGFSAYCRDGGIWRLSFDAWSRRPVVIASGAFDVPRTWFTIEESKTDSGPAYKISSESGDLGVSTDIAGLKVLGVASNNPQSVLNVEFVKKTDEDTVGTYSII